MTATKNSFEIAGRRIGPEQPPYLIAELSGNHNGDLGRALAMVDAAKDAGADAVKIQTYTADTITIDHDGPGFILDQGLWAGRSLHDLYREASTPWDWHEALFDHAARIGLPMFSSPFDHTAVDFLEGLNAPAYKIASFELVDLPLIARSAATGKPMIMSTGMATAEEIEEAVAVVREAGNPLVLLHCISGYPTPIEDSNVRTIPDMAERFSTFTGLSDHSLGHGVAAAAVSLGAVMVEKHFTLSREDGGVDSAFSLEPDEFSTLVETCRTAWAALGRASYDLKPSEMTSRDFRRSLYVVRDMAAGEPFTPETVRSIRPGYGLAPKYLGDVLSGCAARPLRRGEALDWSMIEGDQDFKTGSR
jgi:N-acetylneuraminate synthase